MLLETTNKNQTVVPQYKHTTKTPIAKQHTHTHSKRVNLQSFRGVVFVGGFSYADALGSAKGWAALIKNNNTLNEMFTTFYKRKNSFSLGICNGCQLMALLGWIPFEGIETVSQVNERMNEWSFVNDVCCFFTEL